jgi:hypothetical protein
MNDYFIIMNDYFIIMNDYFIIMNDYFIYFACKTYPLGGAEGGERGASYAKLLSIQKNCS